MTSHNKSHVPMKNNTDAQIEDATLFSPTHPTELTTRLEYVTWISCGDCGDHLRALGEPTKNNSRDFQTLDENTCPS